MGYTRLLLALVCVAWLLARLLHYSRTDLYILLPIVAFIGLSAVHGRLLRAVTTHTRAIDFYDRGLARLNNTWQGTGTTGERFLESDHLGARDLDLFGPASLFELALHGTHPRRGGNTGALAADASAARGGPGAAGCSRRNHPTHRFSRTSLHPGRRRETGRAAHSTDRVGRGPRSAGRAGSALSSPPSSPPSWVWCGF